MRVVACCYYFGSESLRRDMYAVYTLKRQHFAPLIANGYGCKSCTGRHRDIRQCSEMIRLS